MILIPNGFRPRILSLLSEIPKGSKNKYEMDKETGLIILDRVLHTSTDYPASYGFIPRTYGDDFDPLDVLVLCAQPLHPLTLVRCYPIGVIQMLDNGRRDEKLSRYHFRTRIIMITKVFSLCRGIFMTKCAISLAYIKLWKIKDTVVDEVLVRGRRANYPKGNWILSGKIRRNEVMQGRN